MDDSGIFSLKMFFFGFYVQHFGQIEYYYCCYQRQSPYDIEFSSTFFLKTSNISIIFVWLNWEFVYLLKTCWNCVVSSPMWPPDPDIKYDFKKSCHFLDQQIYTWYTLMATDILWNILMFLHANHTKIWKRELMSTIILNNILVD